MIYGTLPEILRFARNLQTADLLSVVYVGFDPHAHQFIGVRGDNEEDIRTFNSLPDARLLGYLNSGTLSKVYELSDTTDFYERIRDTANSGITDPTHFDLSHFAY
jgi:hypothetical protein